MTKLVLATTFLLLSSISVWAQPQTPIPPTGWTIIVVAATGDPLTLPPIGTRSTTLAQALCNQVALPNPTLPLVNPTTAQIDDPNNTGRKCNLPMPVGLPVGTQFRAVSTADATCGAPINGPCSSPRSLVGVPPFDIAPVLTPPVAPTGLVIRP